MPKSLCLATLAAAVAVLVSNTAATSLSERNLRTARRAHLDPLYAAPGDLNYAYDPRFQTSDQLLGGASAAAAFEVTYEGFHPQAQAAFQAAVNVWANTLSSSAPIRVRASLSDLGEGLLGQAGPTVVCSTSAGLANTWYPAALADQLYGSRFCAALAGETYDIGASLNSSVDWDYGTAAPGVPGRYNFMTVVLHEIGHGLGFLGGFRSTAGTARNPYAPNALIYDRFAVSAAGAALLNIAQPSTALHAQLTSDGTYFNGPNASGANAGVPPKLETHHFTNAYGIASDNGWLAGSSYSHLDDVAYTGTPNGLMTWALNSNELYTDPGPLAKALLHDLGWSVATARVPDRATLVSPTATITTAMPTFVWNAAQGATSYDLYVGSAAGGNPLVNTNYPAPAVCSAGICSQPSPLPLPPRDYIWWVRGWNAVGAAPWSDGMRFTVLMAIPTVTGPTGTAAPTVPTYTWTPVPGATHYLVWVQTSAGSLVVRQSYDPSVCDADSCGATPSIGLSPETRHTVWVHVSNSQGIGAWSAGLEFTTGRYPHTATLYGPAGAVSRPAPSYRWLEASNATGYELWVQRAGSSPAIHAVFTTWDQVASELSVTPTTELPDGTYSWWVRTRFSWGPGLWSSPLTFVVEAAVPAAATPTWPSGVHGATRPSYRWTAAAGATWYYFWLAPVGGGPILQSWHFYRNICDARDICTMTADVSLTPGRSYVWYVRSWSSRGDGPWTTGSTFTVTTAVPGAATLIGPSGSGVVDNPTYRWNRRPEATWYQVWVRQVGSTVRVDRWDTADEVCGATTCSVTPSVFLSAYGQYEYYVRTFNENGYGAWSAVMLFSRDP